MKKNNSPEDGIESHSEFTMPVHDNEPDDVYIDRVKSFMYRIQVTKRNYDAWLHEEVTEMWHAIEDLADLRWEIQHNTSYQAFGVEECYKFFSQKKFDRMKDEIGDVYNVFEALVRHTGFSMDQAKEFGEAKILKEKGVRR